MSLWKIMSLLCDAETCKGLQNGKPQGSTLYYRTMYEVGGAMNTVSKTDQKGIVT